MAAPYFYHQIAKPILSVDQKGDRDRLLASGYGFYASDAMNQMLTLTYDDILAQDMVWVGTPAQIANRVATSWPRKSWTSSRSRCCRAARRAASRWSSIAARRNCSAPR